MPSEQTSSAAPAEARGIRHQLSLLRAHQRENGWRWAFYQGLIWTAERVIEFFRKRMRRLELSRGLTGLHTKEANRDGWNRYDWTEGGEEWTPDDEWKQTLIDEVLIPNLPPDPTSLEIGPGGGRWTDALHETSDQLLLADIAEKPLEVCREKFGDADDIAYHVTDGCSLAPVATDSVDFIWSFDVFVHIAPIDQEGYLREFARVMRPGARGVIHHAGRGGLDGGWRSSMTAERFAEMLSANELALTTQLDSWGPEGQFQVPIPGDVITVFGK